MRHRNRLPYPTGVCCMVLLVAACAVKNTPFEIEPSNKATIHTLQALPASTKVHLKISEFKDNETLLLQRCGEPCNTAKLVRRWTKSSIPSNSEIAILLEQAGRYYFWIQRTLDSGEVGPVFATASKVEDGWLVVTFNSGTKISIAVDEPAQVAAVPSAKSSMAKLPPNTSPERARGG